MDAAELSFEQVREGHRVSFEQTITTAQIDAFAALSGDESPLHMDPAFAKARGFAGRVAHGALLNAFVSRLFGMHLPGRDCVLHSVNMRYLLPVYGGETLLFSATVSQKAEAVRTVVAEVVVTRDDAVVAKGKAQLGFTA